MRLKQDPDSRAGIWLRLVAAVLTLAAMSRGVGAQSSEPQPETETQQEVVPEQEVVDPAAAPEELEPSEESLIDPFAEGDENRVPEPGDEVVLYFFDGRRMNGEYIAKSDATTTVKVAGVTLQILNSTIERMVVLDPPVVRYHRMRAMIGEDDAEKLVMLAKWCQTHRLYIQGLEEVERALDAEPHHGEALRLKLLLEQQVELQVKGDPRHQPRVRTRPEPDANGDESDRFTRRPLPKDFPLLTPEQIALIKVYEVDLSDAPRMIVQRATIEKLLARYADHPLIPTTREGREEVFRKSPAQILDLMFRVRARELYAEVQILDQPASMKFFRDKIHAGWLINYMGTTRCHGSDAGGRLMLTNRRPTSDASVYTNFWILENFTLDNGKPLIDFDDPAASPLLQMGLPPDDSLFPHPQVRGWTPFFRSRSDRSFRATVDWIRMLYEPRPDFQLDYTPPTGAAQPDPESPSENVER